MSGDAYDAFDDPYCYKNTSILRNRAELRDASLLQAFELEMSFLRAEEPLPRGRYGAAHYRAIHRHLGNGRSQLSFLHLVALRAGHPVELARVKRARRA